MDFGGIFLGPRAGGPVRQFTFLAKRTERNRLPESIILQQHSPRPRALWGTGHLVRIGHIVISDRGVRRIDVSDRGRLIRVAARLGALGIRRLRRI